MSKVRFVKYNGGIYKKNVLYEIDKELIINFIEQHDDGSSERVDLYFNPGEGQMGFFANEYRSQGVEKEGSKAADVLTGIIDDEKKQIYSIVFDVKRNISAFSDDLTKENAMLTPIKEVRDFIEQIHEELLHKRSFMLYYHDEGYMETEAVGIVTRSFESNKFRDVVRRYNEIFDEGVTANNLVFYKLRNSLRPYKQHIDSVGRFAEKKLLISGKEYDLNVFLLEKISECQYGLRLLIKENIEQIPCLV